MPSVQKITPCLWFDRNAEEASNHYVSIFKNSRIVTTSRYGEAGPLPKGTVLTVIFELEGQRFWGSTADRCSSSAKDLDDGCLRHPG